MKLKRAVAAVQACLTPAALKSEWKKKCARKTGKAARVCGHCYVASQALYYLLGGKASGCKPTVGRDRGGTHWWLTCPTGRVDATAAQFAPGRPPPYQSGKPSFWVSSRKGGLPDSRVRPVLACARRRLRG